MTFGDNFSMEQDEFVSNHVAIEVITPGKEIEFFDLLTRAIREFG
jgi:hypothetical protein